MAIVYMATNQITGDFYIGRTAYNLSSRRLQHIYQSYVKKSKTRFHQAIAQHGVDAFLFEEIGRFGSISESEIEEARLINDKRPQYNSYSGRPGGRDSVDRTRPYPDDWCLAGEDWRDIKGFEGRYQVSDFGRVRSLPCGAGESQRAKGGFPPRILKLRKGKYLTVNLVIGDKYRKCRTVHSLVLGAFVGERPKGNHGCHRDDDPRNNTLSNLYWGTPKENVADALRNGKIGRGGMSPAAKLNDKLVAEIRALRGETSRRAIASRYGVSLSTVNLIHRNKRWCGDNLTSATSPFVRRGENTPKAKLNENRVKEIRRLYMNIPTRDVAAQYGISISMAHRIGKLLAWKHVQ